MRLSGRKTRSVFERGNGTSGTDIQEAAGNLDAIPQHHSELILA